MLMGRHYQNAYVTRNVGKAVEQFKANADVRKVIEIDVPTEVWTPQGSGPARQKLAFVWVEDLNFELIQPVSGFVQIYADALPEGDSLRFHHVCHRVDDWDALRAAVDKGPWPIVLKGGSDLLKFLYIDTREWLGHYVEYVWMMPERWAAMGGR